MKAGDKVVRVDDGPSKAHPDFKSETPRWVKKGVVYVVDAVIPTGHIVWPFHFTCVGLVILGYPVTFRGIELGWNPKRFRLVSEVGHPPIQIEQPQPIHV